MISYNHIQAEFRSRALKEMADDVEIVAVADAMKHEVCGPTKFGGSLYRTAWAPGAERLGSRVYPFREQRAQGDGSRYG
jgi:hypothetical protein